MNRNLFQSKKIMTALLAVGLFTACDSEDDLRTPDSVEIINPSETSFFPSEPISFSAQAEGADYVKWMLDGSEVSTETSFEHVFTKLGSYDLSFTAGITGEGEKTVSSEVEVKAYEGYLVISEGSFGEEGSEGIAFVNEEKELVIPSVFKAQNTAVEGASLGGILQSATIFGDYIYTVSQNGPNYISKLNKETLEVEATLTNLGVKPTNIVMVSEDKGYVSVAYLDGSWTPENSVYAIDFATKTVAKIENAKAGFDQMYLVDEMLYTYEGSTFYQINTTTNNVAISKDLGGSVVGATKDVNNVLWYATINEGNAQLVSVKTAPFEMTTKALDNGVLNLAVGPRGCGLVASLDASELYMTPYNVEVVDSEWGSYNNYYLRNKVYTINTTSAEVGTLVDLSTWSDVEAQQPYGWLDIDEDGDLLLMGHKLYEGTVSALFVVDTEDGEIEDKFTNVGAFPTQILQLD